MKLVQIAYKKYRFIVCKLKDVVKYIIWFLWQISDVQFFECVELSVINKKKVEFAEKKWMFKKESDVFSVYTKKDLQSRNLE